MKNSTKIILGAASLLSVATVALADDAPAPPPGILGPDFTVSAYVALQSDYRFRGISQNAREPAEQGSLNISGPDGFYVGTWVSKINWSGSEGAVLGPNNPSLEVDIYGGKHTDLWGTDLNIEAYEYSYPDAKTQGIGIPNASYFEMITQLSHTFGPLAVTGTWAYSPEFTLAGGTGNYLEGTLAYTINDWLAVSGNVGHQWVQNAKYALGGATGDYTHADFGATLTYKAISLDLRYATTDMNYATCSYYMLETNNHPCSGGFVATLTYNISPFPW
ncbi:MAG TPA: TorF family putative porin [Rhizomicrobium sp.]|nr:TorF family putative porin [Rhizomicrobium sp.]